MAAAAHVLRMLARRDPDLAAELLEEEFAWMHWLPETQRHHCVADLLANLDAGHSPCRLRRIAGDHKSE